MRKLSEHYRNDGSSGLSRTTLAYLDEQYVKRLKNLDYPNPKLLVVFSGGNAVGKTTLARKIEEYFHALVLENDEVKRCLLKLLPSASRDELNRTTWQYTMQLYKRLDKLTPNGLIVRDGIIDWYYDRILPIFEKAGYPIFIVGFDVSREKAVELIHARGDTPTVEEERFYKLLGEHQIHTKRFRRHYTPDVVLSGDNLFDYAPVMTALEAKLKLLLK